MKSIAIKLAKLLGVLLFVGFVVVGYNYLRHIVFWLPVEAVAFESAPGITIRGSLLKPDGEGLFPAVVLLHGAGAESRAGPSYHVLANMIARSGVAVLLYDKRGVGESDGDFASARYSDFIDDAVAAVHFLARREDIDPGNIGLQGNSESGWFTPEIAHRTGKVAWIFNRVGPPLSWIETVLWEVRNDLLDGGVAESEVEPLVAATRRRWEYYIAAAADPSLATGQERDAINAELARLRSGSPAAKSGMPEALAPYDTETYAASAARYAYDPRPFLEAIDIPMIYTFAEADINVPTEKSVAFLETFRGEHDKDIRSEVYEGVGHSMASLGGLLNGGYTQAFVDKLEEWYRDQAVRTARSSP